MHLFYGAGGRFPYARHSPRAPGRETGRVGGKVPPTAYRTPIWRSSKPPDVRQRRTARERFALSCRGDDRSSLPGRDGPRRARTGQDGPGRARTGPERARTGRDRSGRPRRAAARLRNDPPVASACSFLDEQAPGRVDRRVLSIPWLAASAQAGVGARPSRPVVVGIDLQRNVERASRPCAKRATPRVAATALASFSRGCGIAARTAASACSLLDEQAPGRVDR